MAKLDSRKLAVWIAQLALAAVLVGFVGRYVYDNWTELSDLDVTFRLKPLWIVASAVTVWISYGILIEAWRRVIGGWGYRLKYGPALRIWCLSNLGKEWGAHPGKRCQLKPEERTTSRCSSHKKHRRSPAPESTRQVHSLYNQEPGSKLPLRFRIHHR